MLLKAVMEMQDMQNEVRYASPRTDSHQQMQEIP